MMMFLVLVLVFYNNLLYIYNICFSIENPNSHKKTGKAGSLEFAVLLWVFGAIG